MQNKRLAPDISVIVVVHNMAREAPRTLLTLSASHQKNIRADRYEVIVVDNGSTPPFDSLLLDEIGGNFRLIQMEPGNQSPVRAINRGLSEARGRLVGVLIDGARMASPGLLSLAELADKLADRVVILTLGFHLGFEVQMKSVPQGYDQEQEDRLLAQSRWMEDGYRLFDISVFAGSSRNGWFRPISESNAIFMRKTMWVELGGFDERFRTPGGGLANLDTLSRALQLPDIFVVTLLGEGTFHQVHGGVATNAMHSPWATFDSEYREIRGHAFQAPAYRSLYFGGFAAKADVSIGNATFVAELARSEPVGPHFGAYFDQFLRSLAPTPQPADPVVAALVGLAETELCARRFEASATVARIARHCAPDEPRIQRLLAYASAWLSADEPSEDRRASVHLARAKAFRLLGDGKSARSEYLTALNFDADLVEAHIGLCELRMPGDGYLSWLTRLHAELMPDTYLEIGVGRGQSLACVRAPTRAFGVDPHPIINAPLKAETHIFCETSDEFFAKQRLKSLCARGRLALTFIDGLHVFQQSLKDFLNVEAASGPQSIILLHDTIPLDEPTQRPDRQRKFYTGDVWKTVLCLKHYRPDLDVFTIATPWTGLTIVSGLDPASRILPTKYEEAIARFIEMPYSELENHEQMMLNIIPNEWEIVAARLKARGIICRPP